MSPDTEREVLDRLARIEEQIKVFQKHVDDCAEGKRALRASLLVLSGSILIAGTMAFVA